MVLSCVWISAAYPEQYELASYIGYAYVLVSSGVLRNRLVIYAGKQIFVLTRVSWADLEQSWLRRIFSTAHLSSQAAGSPGSTDTNTPQQNHTKKSGSH
jgi:hypothetical protein